MARVVRRAIRPPTSAMVGPSGTSRAARRCRACPRSLAQLGGGLGCRQRAQFGTERAHGVELGPLAEVLLAGDAARGDVDRREDPGGGEVAIEDQERASRSCRARARRRRRPRRRSSTVAITVSEPSDSSSVSRPAPKSGLTRPGSSAATASRESESTSRTTSTPDSARRLARPNASSTSRSCSPGRISAVAIASSASGSGLAPGGDLLGTLVDQQDDELEIVAAGERAGEGAQQRRAAGAGAGLDQHALAVGERRRAGRPRGAARRRRPRRPRARSGACGCTGVASASRVRSAPGSAPLTVSTWISAGWRSPRRGLRAGPATSSPRCSSQRRIWDGET